MFYPLRLKVTNENPGARTRHHREVTNLYDYRDFFYENQEENAQLPGRAQNLTTSLSIRCPPPLKGRFPSWVPPSRDPRIAFLHNKPCGSPQAGGPPILCKLIGKPRFVDQILIDSDPVPPRCGQPLSPPGFQQLSRSHYSTSAWKEFLQQHTVHIRFLIRAAVFHHDHTIIRIDGIEQRGENHAAGRDSKHHQRVDVLRAQDHVEIGSGEGTDPVLDDDDVVADRRNCGMNLTGVSLEELLVPLRMCELRRRAHCAGSPPAAPAESQPARG